jgi:hypothetical protein
MGGDAQLDKVTKTINAGGFDKAAVEYRPQNFSKTVTSKQKERAVQRIMIVFNAK